MKKKQIIIIGLFTLLSVSLTTQVSGAEIDDNSLAQNQLSLSPQAVTVRYWFKTIPPEKYKNRVRIDYFKSGDGYTGVYF